jgi:type I restriction enzyme S subunit
MRNVKVLNSDTVLAKRDDPRFYLPRNFNVEKYGTIKWCELGKMAKVPSSTLNPSKFPNKIFNYIDLADIDEVEGTIVRFQQKKGSEIKGGKRLILGGDVIFARIEPSIFNRKYAYLKSEDIECLGSTELLVARPKQGVSSVYLHWALRNEWVAEQLNPGILTGSTGRRRLKREDFESILIPELSKDEQQEIEEVILTSRAERQKYLELSDKVITDADTKVIKKLYKSKAFVEEIGEVKNCKNKENKQIIVKS